MDIWIGIVIGILIGVVAALGYEIKTLADWITAQPEKSVSECEEPSYEKDSIADDVLVMQERMRSIYYKLDDIEESITEYGQAGLERLKFIEEGVAGYGQEILGRMNSIGESLDDFFDEDEDEDDEDEDDDDDDTLIMEEQMRMISRDLAEKWWGNEDEDDDDDGDSGPDVYSAVDAYNGVVRGFDGLNRLVTDAFANYGETCEDAKDAVYKDIEDRFKHLKSVINEEENRKYGGYMVDDLRENGEK